MDTTTQSNLEAIKDIRKMMERSSRFISLSGWSGVAAGVCALAGSWVIRQRAAIFLDPTSEQYCESCFKREIVIIAFLVFASAFLFAFFFTYLKSRKEGVAIWGNAARRLLWNTLLPMVVGGFMIWKMYDLGYMDLIVPSTLLFYGLALVNGSKYTMGEVRYLGMAEILVGLISLTTPLWSLYAWAFGFGVLHIIYGVAMWWKYERNEQ